MIIRLSTTISGHSIDIAKAKEQYPGLEFEVIWSEYGNSYLYADTRPKHDMDIAFRLFAELANEEIDWSKKCK
jgi:hypothetical protein